MAYPYQRNKALPDSLVYDINANASAYMARGMSCPPTERTPAWQVQVAKLTRAVMMAVDAKKGMTQARTCSLMATAG